MIERTGMMVHVSDVVVGRIVVGVERYIRQVDEERRSNHARPNEDPRC